MVEEPDVLLYKSHSELFCSFENHLIVLAACRSGDILNP